MLQRTISNELRQWSESTHRKPLLLRGARQVGKTSAVRQLAAKSYANFIELNLEDRDLLKHFNTEVGLKDFQILLRTILKFDLTLPNTLLFIDEIQEAPWLLELLRFFYEDLPTLSVIASGSLLEVKLKHKVLSMPVGRIQNLFVYPLTYFEFLDGIGERDLREFLQGVGWQADIPEALHKRALALFHTYALIGGMPEAVATFIEHQDDPIAVTRVLTDLMTTYVEDVAKYTGLRERDQIIHVIENAPLAAGTRYNFKKFASSQYSSSAMIKAFDLLERAMIISQAEATDRTELPIVGQKKRQRKLVFLDVGMVSHRFGLHLDSPQFADLSDLYRGQIAEQVVGQQLVANGLWARNKLHYWAKQTTSGVAEVDFIFENRGRMIALEVKSGSTGRLRSLMSFAESNPTATLTRVYSGTLKTEKHMHVNIHSIPFYLMPRISEL